MDFFEVVAHRSARSAAFVPIRCRTPSRPPRARGRDTRARRRAAPSRGHSSSCATRPVAPTIGRLYRRAWDAGQQLTAATDADRDVKSRRTTPA